MRKWKDFFGWEKDYKRGEKEAEVLKEKLNKIYEKYERLKEMVGETKSPIIKKKILQKDSLEWEDYEFTCRHLPASYMDWMKKAEKELSHRLTEISCGVDNNIIKHNKRIEERQEKLDIRLQKELLRVVQKFFEEFSKRTLYLILTASKYDW